MTLVDRTKRKNGQNGEKRHSTPKQPWSLHAEIHSFVGQPGRVSIFRNIYSTYHPRWMQVLFCFAYATLSIKVNVGLKFSQWFVEACLKFVQIFKWYALHKKKTLESLKDQWYDINNSTGTNWGGFLVLVEDNYMCSSTCTSSLYL